MVSFREKIDTRMVNPLCKFWTCLSALALVTATTLVSAQAPRKAGSDNKNIVTVLRDGDCGSDAITRVKQVADRLGIDITIEEVIVANEEQAKALNWPGSPTVRIRGLDIERRARENTSHAMT